MSTEATRKVGQAAVYNRPIPRLLPLLLPFSPVARPVLAALVVLSCSLTAIAGASDWDAGVQQLAAKIASLTGPGAVELEAGNRSSLSKKDWDEINRGLRARLSAAGVHIVGAEQAAAAVQVSMSENMRNYVWVAQVKQGNGEPAVVMVSIPLGDSGAFLHQAPPMSIRKIPLWSQEERILDLVSLDVNGTPLHLVVLMPEQLAIYRFQDGRYQQDQSLAITHGRPWPRDVRGRLMLSKNHLFDVYLPGVFCESTAVIPLSLACRDSDDPWPLGSGDTAQKAFFSPTRNFFTGVLVPAIGKQNTAPRFYSAVPLPRDGYTLWIVSGVDGQVHLLDGMTDQPAKFGWGSGIVSVKTGCGSGGQVLATRGGESGRDSVRAYQLPDRDPVPVSQAVEFNGDITAFWPEANGSTAMAVSRNPETGKYEAFRLAVSCGL